MLVVSLVGFVFSRFLQMKCMAIYLWIDQLQLVVDLIIHKGKIGEIYNVGANEEGS